MGTRVCTFWVCGPLALWGGAGRGGWCCPVAAAVVFLGCGGGAPGRFREYQC